MFSTSITGRVTNIERLLEHLVNFDELTDRFEVAELRTAPGVVVLIAGRLVQRRGLLRVLVHRFVIVAQQVAHYTRKQNVIFSNREVRFQASLTLRPFLAVATELIFRVKVLQVLLHVLLFLEVVRHRVNPFTSSRTCDNKEASTIPGIRLS